MELRLNRSRVLIALAGVAVVFALIGVAVAPQSRSRPEAPRPEAPGTCADLARDVDPTKEPVDSGYDPEQDLVYAHFDGRTYVMAPDDPLCRSLTSARMVIDHTLEANRENIAVACKALAEVASGERTQFRGRPLNREAAERFIARRCDAPRP